VPKRVHFITDWSTSPSIALHKSSLRCSYVRLLAHCAGQAKTHTSLISYLPVRITTNLPFEEWISVLASEPLTHAMLDRLTHHVHILEMNARSYRLAQSLQARTA
jgi:hypothetical protein